MNSPETRKKIHFSYCLDRSLVRARLESLYRDLVTGDEGDVLTFSFDDLEVYVVIIDD